jgi:hypothetical protein
MKVGRPARSDLDRARTAVWVVAVEVHAKRSRRDLEPLLGPDGRWNGLWSRYDALRVSPTKDRIKRIDRALPGTARYFFSCAWELAAYAELLPSDLREATKGLHPRIAAAFVSDNRSAGGMFWRRPTPWKALLEFALHHLDGDVLCLDAAIILLILLREAHLRQDGVAYISILQAWAQRLTLQFSFSIADALANTLFDLEAAPLRWMIFSHSELQERWLDHVDEYCFAHDNDIRDHNFNMVHFLCWEEHKLNVDDL